MFKKNKNKITKNKRICVLQFAATDETLWFLLPLMKALKADGFEVLSAAKKSPFGPDPEKLDFEFYDLPITRKLHIFQIIRAVFATTKLLKEKSVDILQVHTYAGGIIGRLAGWFSGTPLVIYTAHGWLYTSETPFLKKQIIIFTERIFSWITDHFFIISQEELNIGKQDKILAQKDQTLTLGVGVDCNYFNSQQVSPELRLKLRNEFRIIPNQIVIGFVGRLVQEKGLLELGHAFGMLNREIPNVRLLIIGSADISGRDNSCLESFRKQIAKDNCDEAVIFAGRRNDVRDILGIIDTFVLPSYREGMPVSLLEAMAMCLPCIASDIPGCREEIVDGISGFLVPPRQVDPLYQRLKDLLQSPELAKKMGTAARQRVLDMFSLPKVLEIQLASYNRFRNALVSRESQ